MRDRSAVRSGALARQKGKDRGPLREFLAFKLGAEIYGIEISRIGAILKVPPVTPVPRAPEGVMGIISVRGKVVAVMDLRCKLRLPVLPGTRQSRILLVPIDHGETVGLFVEEVLQVYRLSRDEIEPAASALGSDVGEHVIGIGRQQGALIVLMDVAPMLKRSGTP
jgi:purine-binding chemotaxis protein CheW